MCTSLPSAGLEDVHESNLAGKHVLIKYFDVGGVIQTNGVVCTLSPQKSASESRRLLQKHEAVAL